MVFHFRLCWQRGVGNLCRLPKARFLNVFKDNFVIVRLSPHKTSLIAATRTSNLHRTNGSHKRVVTKRRDSFAYLTCLVKSCSFGYLGIEQLGFQTEYTILFLSIKCSSPSFYSV